MHQNSMIRRWPLQVGAWMVAGAAILALGRQAWAVTPTAQESAAAQKFADERLFSVEPGSLRTPSSTAASRRGSC